MHKLPYCFCFVGGGHFFSDILNAFCFNAVKKAKPSNSGYELVFPVMFICICDEEIPNHMIEIDTRAKHWLLLQSEIFFFFF